MAENAFTPEFVAKQIAKVRQKAAPAAQNGSGRDVPRETSKRAKYGNKPVLVDLGPNGEIVGGKLRLVHTFDSKREAEYFEEVKLRRLAGEINGLELQKSYALLAHVAGESVPDIVGYYEADFVWLELKPSPHIRIIDVKGVKTQAYALKKKLVEACWRVTIEEIR